RDDGPGIAEEHLSYLFERFYRVDKARSRRDREPKQSSKREGEESSGTGLGLAIVQGIVQAHGGEVRVESAIGAGSLFEVRLPLLNGAPERRVDDKSMTKSGDHIHAPFIFSGDTETVSSRRVDEKELSMSQIPLQQQTNTFSAFRVVVVCEAVVFLFAAALHTGAFGVPQLIPAMIV